LKSAVVVLVLEVVMEPCAREIIDLNIKHYRKLLKTETDPSKRETIAKLLAEEEAKLTNLLLRVGR
jgi:hypothetical protein